MKKFLMQWTSLGLIASLLACGPGAPPAPSAPQAERAVPQREAVTLAPDMLDSLVCADTLEGEVEASADGVARYQYRLDVATQALHLEALDAQGERLASLDAEIWLESPLVGRSQILMYDGQGQEVLRSTGRAALEPGFGWRMDIQRSAGEQRVELRAVLTSEPAANQLTVVAPAQEGDPEASPGPRGLEVALPLLDQEGAVGVSRDQLQSWSQQRGVDQALLGQWDQLKAKMLDDESMRLRLFAHLGWCQLDDEGKRQARTAASGVLEQPAQEKPSPTGEDLATRSQALSCAEEEWARETSQNLTGTLDFISTHSGKLALGGPVGYLVDNSGDLGVKLTIDAGEYGKISLTKGDYNIIRDYVKGVVLGGAVALAVANPWGVALAGISAASYIAARVNEAFGEDILRYWLESRNRRRAREQPPSVLSTSNYGDYSSKSGSTGDPHLTTMDGLSYSFQGIGEFVLLRSHEGDLEIQARQVPLQGGPCPDAVAVNEAFALRLGDQVVEVRAQDRDAFWLDGRRVEAARLTLASGAELVQDGPILALRSGRGDVISVLRRGSLHLYLDLGRSRRGQVEGLLGNFNGDTLDDLAYEQGLLREPLPASELHGGFADHWRVTEATQSLFTYPEGEGPDTWNRPGAPESPWTLDQVPAQERQAALQSCQEAGVTHEVVLEQCALDLYCTQGDVEFAEAHARRDDPEEGAQVQLDTPLPVYLDGWTSLDPAHAERWTLSEDAREASLSSTDAPSVLFSDQGFAAVHLEGLLQIDDPEGRGAVGFVMGLSPESSTVLDALVLLWYLPVGQGPPVGVTLARATVDLEGDFTAALRLQQSREGYQVLSAAWGEGQGWPPGQELSWEIDLAPHATRVDLGAYGDHWVDASSLGLDAFVPGRFGFYADQQSQARWSGVTREPLADGFEGLNGCGRTLDDWRDTTGSVFSHSCPPGCEADGIWGTDIYTSDSRLCTAAAHAGRITLEEGGQIWVENLPGQDSYQSSERNGVSSSDWPSWDRSFQLIDAP